MLKKTFSPGKFSLSGSAHKSVLYCKYFIVITASVILILHTLFTALEADICQDINRGFAFSWYFLKWNIFLNKGLQ